ncbi:MAG: ABC transporter ATP-binding protein [Phascolarctobacterium sp.]|uniref:ABC transporter ATP-binding protein n=1 Tax=Phascolarctobacterium sp. TaxID=2049039 RepID=UPI0026DD6092|nr:ABC transporter ATP-binding protein [Phascolarctobacterium sp.]MDO4921654.1 ABC transporter ATP-binding protein [Phascolarctobacterium sp.]
MKINLEELRIQFSGKEILKGVTLEFPAGKFTGLIGPNGSGKSTMLKCIYRILQPDRGAIYIDGKALEEYSVRETARKQAVLAQHNYYNFDFEVLDVVLMGRSPYKRPMEADDEEDYAIARECLAVVGMSAFAHSSFALLSGGEQQRIMLARALAQKTECLILDEPTNHLDIKYQLQLLNIVKSRKLTVVAALHDLNIAAAYCDMLVAMKNGSIVKIGTPQEVLTREFIHEMYEVESEIIRRSDGRILIVYE